MGFFDILVIVFCVLFVVFVIIKAIIDKKNGKSSCGCDCSKCGGSCSIKK